MVLHDAQGHHLVMEIPHPGCATGSPAIAAIKLFDYIEVFYNQERKHSTLGYLSPAQFQRAARMDQAAA